MNAKTLRQLLMLAGLGMSGLAGAQTIPSSCNTTPGPLYCYNWLSGGGALCQDPTGQCCTPASQIQANHPECFATSTPTTPTNPTTPTTPTNPTSPTTPSPSSSSGSVTGDVATAQRLITGTSIKHVLAIASATSSRLLSMGENGPTGVASIGQKTGMAAGGAVQPWNVWANVANTDSSFDKSGYSAQKSSGDVLNTIVGGDYKLGSNLVAGVSAAFDRGNTSMSAAAIPVTTKGYTFAPYLGLMLTKNFSVDATVGYGKGKFSTVGTTADADRSFFAANANYVTWLGNFQLTGKGNYISSVEKYGDTKTNGVTNVNSASKNKLDQLRLGVEVGYWMNGVMPYLGLTYTDDLRRSTALAAGAPWDRSALLLSVGLNFFSLKNGITGGIVYSQEQGRSDSKNKNLVANINVRF